MHSPWASLHPSVTMILSLPFRDFFCRWGCSEVNRSCCISIPVRKQHLIIDIRTEHRIGAQYLIKLFLPQYVVIDKVKSNQSSLIVIKTFHLMKYKCYAIRSSNGSSCLPLHIIIKNILYNQIEPKCYKKFKYKF